MAQTEMSQAERDYNFPPPPPRGGGSLWVDDAPWRVSPALLQMVQRFREQRPGLGDEAPDFRGRLLDGEELVLSDLRGKKHVILLFGSLGDPPCCGNLRATRPSLADLHEKHQAEGVQLIWVYTREAFPGPGARRTSFEQKQANARRFRDELRVPFPIVVDSLDGAIHKQYGLMHNATYAITKGSGVIVYRATNLDSTELGSVIEDLLAWERVENNGQVVKRYYSERIRMARAPYAPESLRAEREALERIGPEAYERIKRFSGFDPYTWQRVTDTPPS